MVEGKNIELIIVFGTALTQVTTLELIGDISIANTDSQVVIIGQF
jgi:hypothetical protein